MNRGLFITFEGPDGSGKTTQIRLLYEKLVSEGLDPLMVREPGGTRISEKIREILLDRNNLEMDPHCEALLYAASRAQLVHQVIIPALESGRTVLCDRFADSSVAYQGFARGLGDGVRIINEFGLGDLSPDITFFLDIDPDQGLLRAAKGRHALDRLELEKSDFHRRVYEGYKAIAERCPERFVLIDAALPADRVFQLIIENYDRYASITGA